MALAPFPFSKGKALGTTTPDKIAGTLDRFSSPIPTPPPPRFTRLKNVQSSPDCAF